MKKLIIIIGLLLGTIVYSQESFVKTYKSYISIEKDVASPELKTTVTVVFNHNGEKLIRFYFPNDKIETYRQVSQIEIGETTGGYKYQYIDAVSTLDGSSVGLQLFDDNDTLRVILEKGDVVEFYE